MHIFKVHEIDSKSPRLATPTSSSHAEIAFCVLRAVRKQDLRQLYLHPLPGVSFVPMYLSL